MNSLEAELLSSREILPGQLLLAFRAPAVAAGAHAGQFVDLRVVDDSGLPRRTPFSLNTLDRTGGDVTLHVDLAARAVAPLGRLRTGDRVEMTGPLGRGYEVDPRTHHLLLVATGHGIAGVRALADEALAGGRRVVLLFGAPTAALVYPSSLLPEEIEYVVATGDGSLGHRGDVVDLVPEYEAWAGQAFASGPLPMLASLARLAAGRDGRLGVARLGRKRRVRSTPLGSPLHRRRSWLQLCLEQYVGCATGTCLGCVVAGVAEPQRTCREGPVFAPDEIAWEQPA